MFKLDENALRYGSLPVDNLFFQDYLPEAKGDYVKVYLYGLYLCQRPAEEMSLALLAHELGMTEAQVEAALRYWERRRLVSRVSDNPPEYLFRSAAQAALSGEAALEADAEFVAFSEDVYALFGDRRKVRPADIALCWEWVQDMNLPQETVMMLLSHMIATRGIQFSFRAAQAEAARMGEEGVASAEDAEAYFTHSRAVQDGAKAVLRQMGKRRAPSQPELDLYRKWTDEWGYAPDAILAALTETTKGDPNFAYLDGILKGIRSRAEARGEAPRTADELAESVQADAADRKAAEDFAHALGLPHATDFVTGTYRSLLETYDPAVILMVAGETYQAGGKLEQTISALERLHAQGIRTPEEAQRYFAEFHQTDKALIALFEQIGQHGKPTRADHTLYKKWLSWGFTEEMLLLAAAQARSASRKMPYMDKILQTWRETGVSTPAQVPAEKPPKPAAGQQYTQRQYTEEELEKRITDL